MGPCRHGFDRPRVLIVEDEGLIAALMVETLADEGFEARSTTEGRAALDLLGSWVPCLILLDIMMPVMDGRAFLDVLGRRADLSAVPVVLASAVGGPLLSDEDMQIADVIRKPFGIETLLETVTRLAR